VTPTGAAEFVTLKAPLPVCSLVNEDIAPTPVSARSWSKWHIASLWVAMSVCIPTYMLSAAMIQAGMTWGQALLAIFLGNAIVLVPLVINAHAGTRYGIPFPVYARAAYGTVGAHVPSLLRSIVACGWFGIQTWIGGLAVNAAFGMIWAGWAGLGGDWAFMGYGLPQYVSFLLFWCVNLYFVWAGTESIKWLETLAAPFLIAMGLALFGWAVTKVGGVAAMLEGSTQLSAGNADMPLGRFVMVLFFPWVTAMVGYWATLSLNIPDFTRFARSQKDQMVGQAMGLLTAMPLFSFIGVAVTSATVLIYGEAIWNPVDLVARLAAESGSVVIGLVAMGAIIVATLSTNIAANIVSPAISFSNVAPRRISFRMGGLIAGVIGIVIFPWRLLDLYQTWLITYSGLLGAVGGVIICDYLLVRKGVLDLAGLYDEDGPYRYGNGVNSSAMIATAVGIGVALLGLLHPSLAFLFNGAWFSAALAAMIVYWILMKPMETT
jgi:nucleobase:cation symporter-1, NCS1 family